MVCNSCQSDAPPTPDPRWRRMLWIALAINLAMFLGEIVGVRRWLAAAVGLIGVLVILRPGSSAFHAAAFFPLVSALAWACTSCRVFSALAMLLWLAARRWFR